MVSPPPKPVFIYGTLRALPILAWAVTGDADSVDYVMGMTRPARIHGYSREPVINGNHPAILKLMPGAWVDGIILTLDTQLQRRRLDAFESGTCFSVPCIVEALGDDGQACELIEADMFVWNGEMDASFDEHPNRDGSADERAAEWIDALLKTKL